MEYVLICGDREWKDEDMIRRVISDLVHEGETVIHGNCRGADKIAGAVAESLGFKVKKEPAKWKKYGKAAGPIRNKKMLLKKPRLVLAFHDHIDDSKGTKDCIEQAQSMGLLTVIVGH